MIYAHTRACAHTIAHHGRVYRRVLTHQVQVSPPPVSKQLSRSTMALRKKAARKSSNIAGESDWSLYFQRRTSSVSGDSTTMVLYDSLLYITTRDIPGGDHAAENFGRRLTRCTFTPTWGIRTDCTHFVLHSKTVRVLHSPTPQTLEILKFDSN